MKKINRALKIFSLIVVLLIIALIAFVATFDANNYKPQIIEQVEAATGRSFSIDGEIGLSLFPWVGLKVEEAWLGNAAGFKAEKFAAIKQLDIKVNVLPLLKKEVVINTIRLHGLNVSLEVTKNKANNWSDFLPAKPASEASASAPAAAEESPEAAPKNEVVTGSSASPLESLSVEGFELVDAMIVYDDRSSNTKASISELNLQTSAIQFDKAVDVRFSAQVKNNNPAIDTRLNLTTQLTFNKKFTVFNLNDLVFTVLATANEFIKQDETLELRSSIDVSMDDQRVTVKQLTLSALGTSTLADVVITDFLQAPLIQANVVVKSFNAREVAKRAGVILPEMAKPDALHNVGLKTKVKLQGEVLEANDFSLTLDSSTLTGWLHIINISRQQLRYELAFDQLNLDDYLPPAAVAVESEVAADNNADAASESAAAVVAATGDEKIVLPLEMLRKLDVEGDFRIASLLAKQYDIKQFLMTIKAAKGDINIKPLSLQVLQGDIVSSVGVNVSRAMPAYAINLDAKQLQMASVANPFLKGVMGDEPLTMEGAANLKVAIKMSGDSVNQLKKSSLGSIILDMEQTEVHGFDPEYFMRSSVASYLDSKGFGLSKTVMGSYKPREVTVFDTIHGTVKLAQGIADTQDFLMDSKRVQVAAKGHADIMQNVLDVTSSIKLARSKTALEKVLDEPLFVRIHGPFTALEYDLDTDRLKKSTTDVLENEAKAKVEAEKQRVKEKLEAEKQQLKARAEEERLRAEEQARQKLKESTEKYEDKLKDKLKGLF